MISIADVWQLIDAHIQPLEPVRRPAAACAGAVLREPVTAPDDNPAFDLSAVDGYAFASLDVADYVLATAAIHADDPGQDSLPAGGTVRVLTGAPVPSNTIAVAKEEDCVVGQDRVARPRDLPAGAFVRRTGDVWRTGDVLLEAPTVLSPATAGLLAAGGRETIAVSPAVRVLHLVTGNELHRCPGQPPPGHVRDSNGPMIAALAAADGGEVTSRWLPDEAGALAEAVAGAEADLILISGGSGHSERDHARRALADNGFALHADGVNTRPGKPLILATRGRTVAFGLPGNPLSHFVCYHVFVRRAVCRLRGGPSPELEPATLASPLIDRGDGRHSWHPARWQRDTTQRAVHPLPWVHSGDLRPLAQVDFLVSTDGAGDLPAGTLVQGLPVRSL